MQPKINLLCVTIALVMACSLVGCASRSQLVKIQSEKEQLKALVEAEKRTNEQLATQLQTATQRAAEAERELALAHGGKPATKPSLVKTRVPAGASPSTLEQWARSESLLKFDSLRRTAQVSVNVVYNSNDRLTLEARRELDKVADLLASPQGMRCGVRLHGIEAKAGDTHAVNRANAAAEYLRQLRGIAENRIEVGGKAAAHLIDEEGRKVGATNTALEVELYELASSTENLANDPSSKGGDGWTRSSGRR
jgi:outer membrane murein-binding lipoprotein Lpp